MKFGFIGAGNMGSAIIAGMIRKYNGEDVFVYDKDKEKTLQIKEKYGICEAEKIEDACNVDFLFLCVKPNVIIDVISEIKEYIKNNVTIVSIAAGKSLFELEAAFCEEIGIIRVMPNTPALVGAGMSAVCCNSYVSEERENVILEVFNSLGNAEKVPENLMDTVTGISGSSPAYVFMFIEAMADAAVRGGMTRNKAYEFAAWAVMGSAKMVLETKKHPGELKDMVCSPGGTTIEAVSNLEKNGFRNAVMEAVKVCIEKSRNM